MDIQQQPHNYDILRWNRIYKYPANYQEAIIHRNASKFGYSNPKMKDGTITPICPCCENYINTVEIPIYYSTLPNRHPTPNEEIFMLPASISLYFTFIKMVITYIVARFLIVDLYNLVTSFNGRYCALLAVKHSRLEKACTTFFISILSGYNKKSAEDRQAMTTLVILNLVFVVLSILYFIWYQSYSYKLYYQLQNNDPTQDDFTVLLENIPTIIFDQDHKTLQQVSFNYRHLIQKSVQNKIHQWVQKIISKSYKKQLHKLPYLQNHFYQQIINKKKPQTFKKIPIVHTITLCYDLTELENLNRTRSFLSDKFIQEMKKSEDTADHKDELQYIPNQIKIINFKYIDLCHLIGKEHHSSFTLSHFVGKAFVTFQYQHYRDYFLREYEKRSNFLVLNRQTKIKISQAPKPNDVFWYHMKVSDIYRIKHMVYSYIIMLIALILSLTGLIALKIWRTSLAQNQERQSAQEKLITFLFNLLMVALTNIINIVLGIGLQKLTEMQKHQSKTARISSLILKNIIAKFLNTTVIYFIFHKMNPVDFLSSQGLVSRIVGLTGFSALIKIGLDLLQPEKKLKKWFYSIKFNQRKQINLFQYQLNQLLQNQEFDLVNQYSYYIYTIYLISFYALLVPLSAPIIILVFSLQYWVDKYNLFKRLSSPVDLGYQLTKLIIKCFQCSLLLFAVGNLYWHSKINRKSSHLCTYINILNVVISSIYLTISLFMPKYLKQKIVGNILKEKVYHHSYSYYLKTNKFNKLFWKQNPTTSFLQEKIKKNSKIKSNSKKHSNRALPSEFVEKQHFVRFSKIDKKQIYIAKYGDEDATFTVESTYSSSSEQLENEEASDDLMDKIQSRVEQKNIKNE